MKKNMAFFLTLVMTIALCLPVSAQAAYQAGTYTGTAQGRNGQILVEVEVSESEILRADVKEHQETAGISDGPIAKIPNEIVKYQSLNIDSVAGATITSEAIVKAAEAALQLAGADVSALYAAIEKEVAEDLELTADVVIIGGGGAGMSAAVSATELGASVIVLEKTGAVGGNSLVSGGIYNAADPERQTSVSATSIDSCYALTQKEARSDLHQQLMNTLKAELDAYTTAGSKGLFDSITLHTLQTYDGGDYVGDLELILNLCQNALPALEWMESLGLEINPQIKQGSGALWQRTHYTYGAYATAYFDVYDNVLSARDNYKLMLNTEAQHLIVDDAGRVVGVEATGETGNKVTVYANNGVILATGGFAGNVDMRVKYCQGDKWPYLGEMLPTSNVAGVTGDGIRMAEEIGVQLVDMDQIQLVHLCDPVTGNTSNQAQNGAGSYLFINTQGNRFVNEGGRRDEISLAVLDQPEGFTWLIQTSDSIKDPETTACIDGIMVSERLKTGETGWCTAETLEGLAQVMDVPYENLKAAVDDYNAHVKTQEKDAFGRTLFSYEFVNGPWYAFKRAPAAHHTMGGVKIDAECHVYNVDNQIIPGLYAAGEVTGDIHGGNRLGGNAIVDFVVYGKIAGMSAAEQK